ncbi:hypothetical protein CFE70_010629 [Pyrenophora teres f. teres 0-1]
MSRNIVIRRVLDNADIHSAAICEIHQTIGHRGVSAVYSMVAQQYYRERLYIDVEAKILTCRECQFLASKRFVYPYGVV